MANNVLDCFNLPLIGISGNCGYDGSSGLSLDQINISLRKAANVSDDEVNGKEMILKVEQAAVLNVVKDIKLELAKEFAFSPVFDVVSKFWAGPKDICKTVNRNTPIGLKIVNSCRDNFRSNRLDWIELYVDKDFTVEAVIQDGEKETKIILEFKQGLNRKKIDYTFESQEGEFWMRLCSDAMAYENLGCGCSNDGYCGCNKCAKVYAIEMVEGEPCEYEEPTEEFLEENGFESEEEYLLSLGYQDSLDNGNKFIDPVCQASSINVFGYQVTCLCSYDWLFCEFQKDIAGAVLLNMGTQIYERAKFAGRFNEWVDAAKDQADYYIKKWNGINPITGQPEGEYKKEIHLIADMMKQYIRKSGTACLSCKEPFFIQTSIP